MNTTLDEIAAIQKELKKRLVELINDENTIIAAVTYSSLDADDDTKERVEIEYIVGDSVEPS